MKSILIIFSVLLIASCAPKNKDNEAIKKQIASYKSKVNKLNQKIADLEQELTADTLSGGSKTLVETTVVQPREFEHFITLSGTVIPEQEAFISPEINGQVTRIHVKEGQRVSRGTQLITLKTDVTEASIREVETSLELAVNLYERQKELWDQKIGSEVQYLQARNNKESLEARLSTLKEQLGMALITAPFSGVVDQISIKEGELASPGIRMLHLVNLQRLKITANLSESYLQDVQRGEMVDIEFPSFPELSKTLPVSRVGTVIDNKSRTFEVEILYDNSNERVKPNQFVNIKINDFKAKDAIVVPSIIIRQDIQGNFLFIASGNEGNRKAEKIYVKPGRTYQEETMVVEGLQPGQQVITRGYNLVKNGTEITN
jgi:membrane fusion protein, multidrug efflux system